MNISAARAEAGDKVILSGSIGDHGTTIMIARGELELETDIESDTAPLNGLVRDMVEAAGSCGPSTEFIACAIPLAAESLPR